jgi:hypothetical protein
MENLPLYLPIFFGITTFLTLFLFLSAMKKSGISYANKIFYFLLFWLTIQMFIGLKGIYYQDLNVLPPKIVLFGIIPTILMMVFTISSKKGKLFIKQLKIKYLTLISIVRIPVEIVLFWLFVHKTIPVEMTFEGFNFDILAGISAVFIFYFGFIRNNLSSKTILIWNFISLGLLINIIILALLSAPTPFQKLGFSQANVAILYFPFIWLPTVIVPIVLFSHIVSIRKLLTSI